MTVIARQLLSEGHAITFAGPPSFRGSSKQRLYFVPLPFDTEAVLKANAKIATGGVRQMLSGARKLFLRTTEGQLKCCRAGKARGLRAGGRHSCWRPTAAEYATFRGAGRVHTVSCIRPIAPPMVSALGVRRARWNWLLWKLSAGSFSACSRSRSTASGRASGCPPLTDVAQPPPVQEPILPWSRARAPAARVARGGSDGYLEPRQRGPCAPRLKPSSRGARTGSTSASAACGSRSAADHARVCRGDAPHGLARGDLTRLGRLRGELPEHCFAMCPTAHSRLFSAHGCARASRWRRTTAQAARAGKPHSSCRTPQTSSSSASGCIRSDRRRAAAGRSRPHRIKPSRSASARCSRTLRCMSGPHSLSTILRAPPDHPPVALLVDRPGTSLPVCLGPLRIGRAAAPAPQSPPSPSSLPSPTALRVTGRSAGEWRASHRGPEAAHGFRAACDVHLHALGNGQ